jgi:hypothetical protein
LSHSFDQACRDVVEFVSKEKIAATIIDQHAYKQPAGAKLYNLEPYDDDHDFEAHSHDNPVPRSIATLNAIYKAEMDAMRMDWLDKLTLEERRRFEHQLCIGCGEECVQESCGQLCNMLKHVTGLSWALPQSPSERGSLLYI